MTECQSLAQRFNEDEAVWERYEERRRALHLLVVDSVTEEILDWLDWLQAERECRKFGSVGSAMEFRISDCGFRN